ncbi:hypothetical protein PHYPSEUDO_013587 [Phytophthora pseudosyringae]|uniref:BZIP domain-containing protein n=1 Tax=Phytophthora pseudosyringae TaxID=221518 RepID=A0A8T1V8I9_9STRA|nr:hypothetical protein PHYPSEUDO_013587 [Phytophthora pseudosyringae]
MDELLPIVVEPTDASLTLEEALELLDNCDVVPNLEAIACGPPDVSLFGAESDTLTVSTEAKKRVRNPLNDVRRRQRRKAERQQLKDQVQQYEAVVERLKSSRTAQGDVESRALARQATAESPWLHAAVGEEHKRRRAEQANATLKCLLVERLQTTASIRDALAKEKVLLAKADPAVGLTLPVAPPNCLELSGVPDDATSLQLRLTVGSIFESTDAAFGSFASSNFDSLESISRVKQQDQTRGPCIELLTTTPLACNFNTAKSVLWDVVTAKEWLGKQNAFHLKTKENSLESVELRFSMKFEGLEQAQITLDGATLLQRRDEEYRTVLAWTTTILKESQELHFQSQGWIVVMKSPANPLAASVIRTCCRISAKQELADIAVPQRCGGHEAIASRKLQNSILRSMGQRVKNRVETVQQSLADRAGPPGSGTLIFV